MKEKRMRIAKCLPYEFILDALEKMGDAVAVVVFTFLLLLS